MTREEALAHIADPNSVFSLPLAHTICETFGVAFPEQIAVSWGSSQEAAEKFDIVVSGPGKGILSIHLSTWVAMRLGVRIQEHRLQDKEGIAYYNAREVGKKLGLTADK